MTHGDAIIILKNRASTRQQKLEAMEVIFNDEMKWDYNRLKRFDLWELTKFIYKEYKAAVWENARKENKNG